MGGELASTTTSTAMTKKKKKKGRPSLLDIQKRSLKQQQQQQHQNPNSFKPNGRRSTRQSPNFHPNHHDNDDDDDDERKQKKHKLLHGLDNSSDNHHQRQQQQQQFPIFSPDYSGPNSILDASDALNRRKISSVSVPTRSDQTEEKVSKATDTLHGSPVDSGPTTPLPDKKLLVFVLDRLQKKDTYGVFSEPVDPEELPDYHEIIAHPMDFATVRKKLDGGAYANLEHFEKDVCLICTNAMQYNAPDTIYFRQARSILELAKKDFENLRQDSDSEPQPQPQAKVARRGRPPKILKKSLDTSPSDRVTCDLSSDVILANGGDNGSWSGAHNLRKGPITSFKFRPADALNRASHGSYNVETSNIWLSEWENEFPASVVKAVLRYGKKQFTDENRRDTYKDALSSRHEPSVFTTFEGELKQLTVVGLNSEHGYARSLDRFAADLGPIVWKIASKKIGSVLPVGVKFSPGWVGENRPIEQQQQHCYAEKQKFSNNNLSFDHSSRLLSPTTSGSNSAVGNRYSAQVEEDTESMREVNTQSSSMFPNNTLSGLKSVPPFQSQSRPVNHSDMNGFIGTGGFGFNSPPQVGTAGLATIPGNRFDNSLMASQMLGTNSYHPGCSMPANNHDTNVVAKLADCSSGLHPENSLVLASASRSHTASDLGLEGDSSWQGLPALNKQDFHSFPPDLNVRFLAPGSPMSNIQISSPQQPDLALQL